MYFLLHEIHDFLHTQKDRDCIISIVLLALNMLFTHQGQVNVTTFFLNLNDEINVVFAAM